MKDSRKNISHATLRNLTVFYNGRRCIIKDKLENTDWHHLDDNPANSTFTNLIPISRDFNNDLEKYRRYQKTHSKWIEINNILTPSELFNRSKRMFFEGKIAQAYGCARLAFWLIKLYPNVIYDRQKLADYILHALSCARHAAAIPLIIDILERDINVFASEINLLDRLKIILELGAILQEYGEYGLAHEVFNIVENKIITLDPLNENEFRVRLFRRFALLCIANSSNLNKAEELLVESTKNLSSVQANSSIGVENALAWLAMAKNNRNQALDILLPMINKIFQKDGLYKAKIVAPWNALETLLSCYTITSTRKESTIRELLRVMLDNFNRNAIQLRPIALKLSTNFSNVHVNKSLELYYDELKVRKDFLSTEDKSVIVRLIKKLSQI